MLGHADVRTLSTSRTHATSTDPCTNLEGLSRNIVSPRKVDNDFRRRYRWVELDHSGQHLRSSYDITVHSKIEKPTGRRTCGLEKGLDAVSAD